MPDLPPHTDESNNDVAEDTTPPTIKGVHDISILVGASIAYKKGVSVTDDFDETPTLTVDSSAVKTNVPGAYTVVYTAKDTAGNEASATAKVIVREVSADDVAPLLDTIIGSIITEGMTQRQQAKAICAYVKSNVSYRQNGIHDDLYRAAYTGIKTQSGDCYTYYALAELLLTRVGIANTVITRTSEATGRHWWNLVLYDGDDEWYHFDACIHNTAVESMTPDIRWYAFTESEAQRYTTAYDSIADYVVYYYVYDDLGYPDIKE
jgi:hypothetical protein